jgi:hypothetical protein
MREHLQAPRISEEEVDRRTAEAEVGTRIPAQGVDRRTSEVEAGTRIPAQEADTRTAEQEAGRNIAAQVVDSRCREVEKCSTSSAKGTSALLVASERNSRTCLTRLRSRVGKMDKRCVRPCNVRGKILT